MKSLAILICALMALPVAFAEEASKNAKIEQLLLAMNVEAQQKAMMDQMTQMVIQQVREQMARDGRSTPEQMAQMEERQKRLMALIAQKTSWDKMKPVFVKSYSDTFTEPEIDGMLAFYKSPAGQAMVAKQPTLSSKIMTNVQAQMADLMPQIEEIMKP